MLSAAQAISSEGLCQSFGENGDGYVPGEGVGVVVLKGLAEAERDGDHIYGVIRGSALIMGQDERVYSANPQRKQFDPWGAGGSENRGAAYQLYRGAWNGDQAGGPDRDRGIESSFPGRDRREAILRDRIGEVEHRAPGVGAG